MIEYLDENFELRVIDGENECAPESWLLVPEGANILVSLNSGCKAFYKDGFKKVWDCGSWCNTSSAENLKTKHRLWQRKDGHVVDAEFFEEGKKIKTVDETLSERQSQYGCFEDVAKTTQDILKALRVGNYDGIPDPHKESLHMIASKMARLVHGDHNHIDGWVDIGGYSKLIVNLIGGENE